MDHSNNIDETLEVISQVLIRCVVIGVLVLLFWSGALALMGDLGIPCTRQSDPYLQATLRCHSLRGYAHDQSSCIPALLFSIYRHQTGHQETGQ